MVSTTWYLDTHPTRIYPGRMFPPPKKNTNTTKALLQISNIEFAGYATNCIIYFLSNKFVNLK